MKEPTNSREFAKESRKGGKGISGQNEPNFQSRGNGISEIEGKAARVVVSESGSRTSFKWILFNSVDSVISVISASSVVKNNFAT